ncbi:uncharacterized protein LOC132202479 [Neocloeon triangulifer]|uniref:uncharacterized protein LOC132202479 n=1 Tax=Neocloeon triangulifer TaxID=2078957 RepID=UPI00286F1468|nr:uncharacterized protein LOC132202479 [Neocloeon triangulifer]
MMWLILLTVCIIAGVNSAAKSNSPFDEIPELLNYGEQLSIPEDDLIVLMGSSGVDKGTLIKFVIQDETLKVRRRGSRLVFESGRNVNRTQFQDVLPHFYRDKATGHVLVDVPGFSESREPKADISNAYFTKRVLQQAKNLKLIFVENHVNLMEGADFASLSKLLRRAAKQVPDIKQFSDSVGLVVAKVHDQNLDDADILGEVLNQLTAMKEELNSQLEDQIEASAEHNEISGMLDVLDAIYANGTAENIALFRRPDQEGSPWASSLMTKSQRELRVLFFGSLKFSLNGFEFPYSVLHRSRDYITNNLIPKNNQMTSRYFKKILKEFHGCVENEAKAKFVVLEKVNLFSKVSANLDILLNRSDIFDNLEKIVALKENLATVCAAWKNIDLSILNNLLKTTKLSYDLAGSDVSGFLKEVKDIVTEEAKSFKDIFNFYIFLESLNRELKSYAVQVIRKAAFIELTAANYKEFIFNLSKFNIKVEKKSKVIAMEPTKMMFSDLNIVLDQNLNHTTRRSFNNFGQELIFEGRNLILSEIVSEMLKYQNLENVYLFAYRTIFIDCNLTLIDANISMAAPIIEIIGENIVFQLNGSDAKNEINKTKSRGRDGLPGEDGRSAGNTLILALELRGAEKLTIRSRGGNGANGQDGVNGLKGISSPQPHFDEFYPEFVNGIPNWEFIKNHGYNIEHPDKDTIVLVNRQGAKAPTSGGHGGAGGKAGAAGGNFVLVQKEDDSNNPVIEMNDGVPGKHGKGGIGGSGHQTCAKNVYSGMCKTKNCEVKFLSTFSRCKCKFQSVQYCDKEADAKDGLEGHVKNNSQQTKRTVDWVDFARKFNSSILFDKNLVGTEDQESASKFILYAQIVMKTAMQIFRGFNMD